MKVLITGAHGQLGGALQRTAPASAQITAIDVEHVDLTDSEALRGKIASEAPDLILNAAAYTAVDKAESEPDAAALGNVEGPKLGADEGPSLEAAEGDSVGVSLGKLEGALEGAAEGIWLGEDDGRLLGEKVGTMDGSNEG